MKNDKISHFPGHTNPPPLPAAPAVDKSCRISIKGEFPKDLLASWLKHFEDLQRRGFKFARHKRYDLPSGKISIDYVFEKK